MTREIKFRSWNTISKKMFSAEEMAKDQLTLLPTGEFINVHGVSTKLSEIYPTDVMIPLQFTGLLDRNGKEIYEGDIIKTAEEHLEGVWKSPSHNVVVEWPFLLLNSVLAGEIIGNIYDNPEL